MVETLIYFHSLLRWLVLFALLLAIYRAFRGLSARQVFSKTDNAIRHWTATIAHVQLVVGITLYTQSPVIRWFWGNFSEAVKNPDTLFFGLIHSLLMVTAIVVLTIGSALTKRRTTDAEKYKTMLTWFSLALVIILIAVPWPFSPWAARPYTR